MSKEVKEVKKVEAAPELTDQQKAEAQEKAQELYRKRLEALMVPIGKHLDAEKITSAVIVVIDPVTNQPMLTYRGDVYGAAQLSKWMFGQFRRKVAEALTLEE
jgi:hypothetical protein